MKFNSANSFYNKMRPDEYNWERRRLSAGGFLVTSLAAANYPARVLSQ